MNSTIYLSQSVSIDLPTLLDTRLLVQANSGGGKSWLLRRLLEQSHGKVQQIVIDLEGEFATLREQYDYVLAGKEGDTPADPRSAGLLAKRLLERHFNS
jgi:DNA helicase HerA-like ATPase